MSASIETAPRSLAFDEANLAIWNALKLGASLVLTWGVSLAIRALLPRHLGPDRFGEYSFAEAAAATVFVLTTLGIETYVHKQVPVRPAHASDFFGGLVALRGTLGAALLALLGLGLFATGRSPEVIAASLLFGVGQLLFVNNATLQTMLNARGRVDGMTVVNVLAKAGWAGCIGAAIVFSHGLAPLAAAFIAGEALRGAALYQLCRRHLGLRFTIDGAQVREVLRRSAPFFVTTLALTIYARFDLMLLGYLAPPVEVGWYAASSQIENLGLLLAPLVAAVCLPMFSRARQSSEAELGICVRRSLEVVLLLAIPVSLAIWLGADVWIRMFGGPGFEPAARPLRAVAPVFVLTYVAMLGSSYLNLVDHAWTVTRACLAGIFVNTALNVVLIRYAGPHLGIGGQAVGAALAAVLTEVFVCGILLGVIGRRLLDGRLFAAIGKTLAVCAAVVLVDRALAPLGPARLVIDGAAYVLFAFGARVFRADEIRTVVAAVRRR